MNKMNKHQLFRRTITTAKAALIGFACISIALGDTKSDELKHRLLAQAQSLGPDDYSFTRTSRSEQTSSGKTEVRTTVEKFDPTKSGDGRWTLVSVDGAPPAGDLLSKYRKESSKRRVPGYHRMANYLAAPATASTDSHGRTVFHFGSLPKESALVMDSDVSSNTSADVTVTEANGTAFAEQVRLSVKPTRIKLIMKLDRYESTSRYRMGPEGKPLLMEQVADMSGSGMGQEGQIRNVITYSDYRAAR
jgi:hypothetical protein